MQFASSTRKRRSLGALAAILAVASVLPLLPVSGEPAAAPQTPGVTLTPAPANPDLARLFAPLPFPGQALGAGATEKTPVSLLQQLRSLFAATQAALQRAEQNAKNTATTAQLPKAGAAKSNTLLVKLRAAREAALDALWEFEKSPQGAKERDELDAAWVAQSNQVKLQLKQMDAQSAKSSALIEANQKKIDALSKLLEQGEPDMKAYEARRAESAKLQKSADETNRRGKEIDQAAQREQERARRSEEWLNRKKSSVKNSSFRFQPRLDGPEISNGRSIFRTLNLPSDDCGTGWQTQAVVGELFAQADPCQEARQARANANQAVTDTRATRDGAQTAFNAAQTAKTQAEQARMIANETYLRAESATRIARQTVLDTQVALALAQRRVQLAQEAYDAAQAELIAAKTAFENIQDRNAWTAAQTRLTTATDAANAASSALQRAKFDVENLKGTLITEQDKLVRAQATQLQAQIDLSKATLAFDRAERDLADKNNALLAANGALLLAEQALAAANADVVRFCGGIIA